MLEAKIYYDDNFYDVIGKINDLLLGLHVRIYIDDNDHDGYDLITLETYKEGE